MAPPAKRRKRNLVHSDDEGEAKPKQNTLANYLFSSPERPSNSAPAATRLASDSPSPIARKPARPPAPTTQTSKPAVKALQLRSNGPNRAATRSVSTSTSASPEKPNTRPSRTKLDDRGKTADIKTLFSRQAERTPADVPTKLDDILSDPISDDDGVKEHKASMGSHIGKNALKRFKDSTPSSGSALTVSQRFLRPPKPAREPAPEIDQRPWSERFGPVNLDELAVHKRKVADVRKWLEDVTAGRLRQRLLILKGAAGTGKTTTVKLLARDMRCELLEWKNPTSAGGLGFQSASVQFEEFLGRSGKFSQLDLDTDTDSAATTTSTATGRKVILIEEFPNTFTRSSTALQSFRGAIMSYLVSNTPSLAAFTHSGSKNPITPVVMVISETLLTTTSASADSFTVHRLLGPEITRHPGAAMIEFNAIAPTLLSAALELIVQKEARKSGRKRTPGPTVLKRLGEIGDIRSAASSLEFLCLKGDSDTDWGSKVTFTKPKRSIKSNIALTKGEEESLQLISQREASLGIFHAVGKVMYNKRDEVPLSDQTDEGQAERLPGFMAHRSRPRRSEVSVDSLVDETGTDTHTFISALHENYVLSCSSTGPGDLSSSVDYMNECLEYLSDSDLLCPSSDIFFGGRGFGGFGGRDSASHVLKQEEITFQVATRGMLFSLPYPVKRIGTTAHRGGGDAHKMFYPTSLKLWREKEELESVVDLWSTRLLTGEEETVTYDVTEGATVFRKPKPNDSGSWMDKQGPKKSGVQSHTSAKPQGDSAPPLLSLGNSARNELLLERLPYLAHIARRKKGTVSNFRLKELEKVVSFSGVNGGGDEDAAVEGDEVYPADGDAWATDKAADEQSPLKKSMGVRQKGKDVSVADLPVQSLVISYDDIEDD
ncbi:Rad17 cell cycle checkpoint protein-domain-containing protein [Truncatella angustata]|uniref:Rad17 cell cycle checkpoint protein-domain-containing protein n=1 Tax=Truncatella angustata TaxID=152316 RepID=A0A9P8UZ79_9PEZI|nr:Rad17 cell cycle checkpoint protein-domain-containing protein [Truncatella angustata]KAH6660599.1 Rad17 cell cycle checkpoint protein-domain-containing protein [Truncatella angustata]